MNPLIDIYAKSPDNGGTTLYDHLLHVAVVAEGFARYRSMDERLARLGAYLHDIGKVHPEFQAMLNGVRPKHPIPLRHELVSLLFLPAFPRENWAVLVEIVVAHHRSLREDSKKQGLLDILDRFRIEKVIARYMNDWEAWSLDACEILQALDSSLFNAGMPVISRDAAMEALHFAVVHCENIYKKFDWSRWKGLLVGADHIASALAEATFARVPLLFAKPDISDYQNEDRKSDIYPLSRLSDDDPRPHTFVIAPTGAGKTDYLMRRTRGRVFYTLPFQASINAMFRRFRKDLASQKDMIHVLHAASTLAVEGEKKQEEKLLQDKVGAAIKVLTPHQLAALICGTRGFETVALDVQGCDVILDEIHSYSGVAQSMVLEIIKVLLRLGCRIHIGSATMPSALTNAVLALLGGETTTLVTRLADEKLDTFDRHIIHKHASYEAASALIAPAIAGGEKVLVVCNRVNIAQERFDALRTLFPDVPAMLVHSRFRRQDRSEAEKELTEQYNKQKGACIVVATQVVEVSLDISFDMMITDAAPIDALIQRFGRINRWRTETTVAEGKTKCIHVIAPPEKGDVKPYERDVIIRSFEQLPDGETFRERDVQARIDAVYPRIEVRSIAMQIVWQGEQFLVHELCHAPSSNLMELLDIDADCCVLASEETLYRKGSRETRTLLEIPVPPSVAKKLLAKGRRLEKIGSAPIIVTDALYKKESGLHTP